MRNSKKRLALFASGRGSNGEALYKAMQEGYINGEFVVIITDHGTAGIVERSKSWNIPRFRAFYNSCCTMIRNDYNKFTVNIAFLHSLIQCFTIRTTTTGKEG